MSNALTVHDDMSLSDLGNVLAKSGFFQDARDASQAIVKVLAGRELGFGPIASMTGVYIVKGRPALSANLMAAAIKRSGRYTYRVVRLDDQACEIAFFENGQEIGRSTFTADDARRAGTQNMDKFPRNMLFARALSNGAKWFCPDIFGGPVYTPEELGAAVDEDGDVIDGQVIISSPAYSELANNPPPTVEEDRCPSCGQLDGFHASNCPEFHKQMAPPPEPTLLQAVKYTVKSGKTGDLLELGELTDDQLAKVVELTKDPKAKKAAQYLLERAHKEDQKLWSELFNRAKKEGFSEDQLPALPGDATAIELYRQYHAMEIALEEIYEQAF